MKKQRYVIYRLLEKGDALSQEAVSKVEERLPWVRKKHEVVVGMANGKMQRLFTLICQEQQRGHSMAARVLHGMFLLEFLKKYPDQFDAIGPKGLKLRRGWYIISLRLRSQSR